MDEGDQTLLKPAAEKLAETGNTVARSTGTVAATAKAVERSTKEVEQSTRQVLRDTDRQMQLAADRTLLAAERTYAAWVRTALAALASGVGAVALLEDVIPLWLAKITGSMLVLFAGFCLVAAVWRQLRRAVPPPSTDLRPVPRFAFVPMNAFLLLVAAAALFGIWVS